MTSWFDDTQNGPVIVIDTPGIGDAQNRDSGHISQMVQSLKEIGYIHSFVIVLNSQSPRFDEQLKGALKLF